MGISLTFQLHHSFLVLYIHHTLFGFWALACAVPFAQNISSSSVACYRPLILSKFQFKCCIFREVFLGSPIISYSYNILYHPKIFPSNKYVRDHIGRIQNCTPDLPLSLVDGQLIYIPCLNKWRKVIMATKGRMRKLDSYYIRIKISYVLETICILEALLWPKEVS